MPINTVTGPIQPDELGITLSHEHILIDLTCWFAEPKTASRRAMAEEPVSLSNMRFLLRDMQNVTRDNLRLQDVDMMVEEVTDYRYAGGGTIVEVSSVSLARDPQGLKRISQRSGVNIVMGAGYYCAASHPPSLASRSIEDIQAEMVNDITIGVDGTGIKAGVMGELGSSQTMTAVEETVLRAAGRASRTTGVPMIVHVDSRSSGAARIVEILEEEQARHDRIVLSHMDIQEDLELKVELAQKGVYINYDTFGGEWYVESWIGGQQFPTDTQRIQGLKQLIDRGCLERLMLSQDVCSKIQLHRYGRWGYDHILVNVVPMMRRNGITDEQIHTMLVDNPRRMLTPTLDA